MNKPLYKNLQNKSAKFSVFGACSGFTYSVLLEAVQYQSLIEMLMKPQTFI